MQIALKKKPQLIHSQLGTYALQMNRLLVILSILKEAALNKFALNEVLVLLFDHVATSPSSFSNSLDLSQFIDKEAEADRTHLIVQ